jgi:hypothetical protein
MPQLKKKESLTFGDRLITALLGGICAFATMCLIWVVVMYLGGRRGADVSMPFYWVWIVTGIVSALAYVAGPEKTMDTFGRVWGWIGAVFGIRH